MHVLKKEDKVQGIHILLVLNSTAYSLYEFENITESASQLSQLQDCNAATARCDAVCFPGPWQGPSESIRVKYLARCLTGSGCSNPGCYC